LKIALVGYFPEHTDEGVRNITQNVYNWLSKTNPVLKVNVLGSLLQISKIIHFKPDIVHVISGPSTIRIFCVAKIISVITGKKVILSAVHLGHISFRVFIKYLKPELVLVQSKQTNSYFIGLGCRTKFLPNGVDLERFTPVDQEHKFQLRQKYGIAKEKYVILHVGHIRKGRNVSTLKNLEQSENQVIIVGSTSTSMEYEVYKELIDSGCIVWVQYFEHIEEIYALSDCYIFPTTDRYSCIETPMSVLEAMACNLPIITTRFGAIPHLFTEDKDLLFFEKNDELSEKVRILKKSHSATKNREKVTSYSWDHISDEIKEIYNECLH